MTNSNTSSLNLNDSCFGAERYFCQNDLLNLRRAFSWIKFGKYIADKDKTSPHDIELAYIGDNKHIYARADFKYTPDYDLMSAAQYTLSLNCYYSLKAVEYSLLFVYVKNTSMLYAIDVTLAEHVEVDDSTVRITNLQELIIDKKYWPQI